MIEEITKMPSIRLFKKTFQVKKKDGIQLATAATWHLFFRKIPKFKGGIMKWYITTK